MVCRNQLLVVKKFYNPTSSIKKGLASRRRTSILEKKDFFYRKTTLKIVNAYYFFYSARKTEKRITAKTTNLNNGGKIMMLPASFSETRDNQIAAADFLKLSESEHTLIGSTQRRMTEPEPTTSSPELLAWTPSCEVHASPVQGQDETTLLINNEEMSEKKAMPSTQKTPRGEEQVEGDRPTVSPPVNNSTAVVKTTKTRNNFT